MKLGLSLKMETTGADTGHERMEYPEMLEKEKVSEQTDERISMFQPSDHYLEKSFL